LAEGVERVDVNSEHGRTTIKVMLPHHSERDGCRRHGGGGERALGDADVGPAETRQIRQNDTRSEPFGASLSG
jgi:hypothetical protein